MSGNCSCCMCMSMLCLLLAQENDQVENRFKTTRKYSIEKRFLTDQIRDPKSKLNELIAFEYEEAQTVLMYFGIGPYDIPKSQEKLARELRLSTDMVCLRINSVLCYLGCPGKWNVRPHKIAERILNRVIRERKLRLKVKKELVETKKQIDLARSIGLSRFPKGMPEEKLSDLKVVVEAQVRGKITVADSKHYVILLEFGLVGSNGDRDLIYRSAKKISKLTGHCTATIARWRKEVFDELRS